VLPSSRIAALLIALGCLAGTAIAQDTRLKSESFDKDPGWEGFNNRVVPQKPLIVRQDFGYSPTRFAGDGTGEIGGTIQRSATPATYAAKIEPKTLDDSIAASGTFAITASQPGAGVFFGFFNSNQPGGSGRPIGSLGLDFDFEHSGGRLAVRLISDDNKSCGTFATPYVPGKFRPTPLKNDGTRYDWTLRYDPQAAEGNGRFTFTLSSKSHKVQDYGELTDVAQKEAAVRFPLTTKFEVDLPPGFKGHGATFDRFGLHNMMKAGGSATIYFDDIQLDGQSIDFEHDPGWLGARNREIFEEREQVGAHNFGFSPQTTHAGGAPGEVGGSLWRSGDFAYYADRVGPLDLTQRLEARGKITLVTAGPDSDIFLGWFNSESQKRASGEAQDFVGVHIGGPTRVGHYFIPVFATSKRSTGKVEHGPVLAPGKTFDWTLSYDPTANAGQGEIAVRLGSEFVTLAMKPKLETEGARFDRFGLFTSTIGGQMVKVYLDDLHYTAAGAER
jgi:hypothetical protein